MKKVIIYVLIVLAVASGWMMTIITKTNSNQAINQWSSLTDNLRAENASLKTELDKAITTSQTAEQKGITLRKSILCPGAESYKFDLSSNASVSLDLETYAGDRYGNVAKDNWDVIWTNTKDAIHKLQGDNLYVYVVGFGFAPGSDRFIFDVQEHCYLVTPE